MELLDNIAGGFATAVTPINLMYCLFGAILGTVIGLLPGLGAPTGTALLLPLTLGLEPVTGLIMLAGIYYGAQYGGTISSVLVRTPGESASVVTTFDGYQMARQGRAGPALAIAAIGSFLAGTISIVFLMTIAPLFSSIALRFGPPEIFALIVMGLTSVAGFSGRDMLKGLAMAALGLTVAMVGIDAQTGVSRFTFGTQNLLGGIGFLEAVIGLFAIGEVTRQVSMGGAEPIRTRLREMLLTREDWRRARVPIVRGGLVGFLVGMLPGAGATLASFFAYDVERRASKHPERFGTGMIEGVAGPEAANNAAVNGTFVPTLTLGIPASATQAVLLGAFLLYGIQPGPLLMEEQAGLVWGLIASFYVGNCILLLLNLPLAPLFASLLRMRYSYMYPVILLLSFVGAYSAENRLWGTWVALAFGILGYLLARHSYPLAPLVLGLVLGPLAESTLVQTSSISGGDFTIFLRRPIALALFVLAGLILGGGPLLRRLRGRREPEVPAAPPKSTPAGHPTSTAAGHDQPRKEEAP